MEDKKADTDILILLTNDDGIYAQGLQTLYNEIKDLGEVLVVAPATEQSAVGHAITLSAPLRVWKYSRDGYNSAYAVGGTPADCVKIAYWVLLKEERKPSIVISGINPGSNTGINAIYSGTVSAATEGAILGIPSFAISLATVKDPDFTFAAKFAKKLILKILKRDLPKGVYLNVNIPAVPEQEISGVVITTQGRAVYHERYEMRHDPHGRAYYWLTGEKVNVEKDERVDDRAILQNKVSITPIHYDLTHYAFLDELRSWDFD
jgi:5'-nucleotidase